MWIDKIQIQEFIELKPFKACFFPEVHINKNNRISGETLCCFNGLNILNRNKILYNLYGLFRMIYDEVALTFPNAKVDLYYNEANSEHFALTLKFAADINPSESSKYCEEVHKGFMTLFMNNFICDFSKCFLVENCLVENLFGVYQNT